MKHIWSTMAVLAGAAQLGAAEVPVQFHMPDTGLAPSYGMVEAATRMGERHGGSSLSWTACHVTVPFLDPRQSNVGNWRVNACLDADATFLNTSGDLAMHSNELYTFTLPLTMVYPTDNGYFAMGVAPCVASDFTSLAHAWDVPAFARYQMRLNDNFTFSVGAALSPRFAKHTVIPMLGFSWTPTPDWEVRLNAMQLSALYNAGERLKIGPFVGARGGSWMVDTPAGDRIFRLHGLVAGVTAEYDFHQGDDPKRIIFVSVGMTAATRVDFCDRTAGKDHVETHHYKPGAYVSFGVDFRF